MNNTQIYTPPKLRLDWCNYKTAEYAIKHWHYSAKMPVGKLEMIGIWENESIVGVILYSRGAGNAAHGARFGLKQRGEMLELARVACRKHVTPTSKFVSISLKMIKKALPEIRLIISYADPLYNHIGTIYQASGWVYIGRQEHPLNLYIDSKGYEHNDRGTSKSGYKIIFGKRRPVLRPQEATRTIIQPGKYTYLYVLDPTIKDYIYNLAQPYPKHKNSNTPIIIEKRYTSIESIDSDASTIHVEEGGAIPTSVLQKMYYEQGLFGIVKITCTICNYVMSLSEHTEFPLGIENYSIIHLSNNSHRKVIKENGSTLKILEGYINSHV